MLMKLEYIFDIYFVLNENTGACFIVQLTMIKKITTENHLQNCDYIFIKTQKL